MARTSEPADSLRGFLWIRPGDAGLGALLEIARLLDQKGDRETAAREYERFLDHWSEADEGLPELLEAERYLRIRGG